VPTSDLLRVEELYHRFMVVTRRHPHGDAFVKLDRAFRARRQFELGDRVRRRIAMGGGFEGEVDGLFPFAAEFALDRHRRFEQREFAPFPVADDGCVGPESFFDLQSGEDPPRVFVQRSERFREGFDQKARGFTRGDFRELFLGFQSFGGGLRTREPFTLFLLFAFDGGFFGGGRSRWKSRDGGRSGGFRASLSAPNDNGTTKPKHSRIAKQRIQARRETDRHRLTSARFP
jgi:hypothetical protein